MKMTYQELVDANRVADEIVRKRFANIERNIARLERLASFMFVSVSLVCLWEIAVLIVKVIEQRFGC